MDDIPIYPVLAPTISSFPVHPRKAIDVLSSHSWRGIQIDARADGTRPSQLGISARRDLAGLLHRQGMVLAGLDLWLPESAFFEADTIERAVDRTVECIDLATDLGNCPISMLLPKQVDSSELDSALEVILAKAGGRGVRIADYARDAPGMEPVDVQSHGLGLDPASLLMAGEDPAAAALAWGDRLASARLVDLTGEGNRTVPSMGGRGQLDLVSYKISLGLNPGGRCVVVDLRDCPDPLQGLVQAGEAWESAS